jgi:hypothetical protein
MLIFDDPKPGLLDGFEVLHDTGLYGVRAHQVNDVFTARGDDREVPVGTTQRPRSRSRGLLLIPRRQRFREFDDVFLTGLYERDDCYDSRRTKMVRNVANIWSLTALSALNESAERQYVRRVAVR